jgi:hypothetical protein
VKMGRREVAAIGGFGGASVLESAVGLDVAGLEVVDGLELGFESEERPEITGGGSSSPSVALRLSCRAKSEACHHSRNFRAKMLVGRRNLRLDRRRG